MLASWPVMPMMAAMEEVQQRADQQECVGDQTEQVLPMLGVEQTGGDESCRDCRQQPGPLVGQVHSAILLSRRELPMTLTEDSAIAAAAKIGESMSPNSG